MPKVQQSYELKTTRPTRLPKPPPRAYQGQGRASKDQNLGRRSTPGKKAGRDRTQAERDGMYQELKEDKGGKCCVLM